MYSKISDSLKVLAAMGNADFVGGATTPYVAVSDARKLMAVVAIGPLAATKTTTIQFKQATDTAGTGAKNLGTAVIYTSPAGGVTSASFTADAQITDLDDLNGFDFVAVNVTSNAAVANPGGVALLGGIDRFNP